MRESREANKCNCVKKSKKMARIASELRERESRRILLTEDAIMRLANTFIQYCWFGGKRGNKERSPNQNS